MLSFDSSNQKSAESRTGFAYPIQHLFMNFRRPLLLYPPQKHFEGAEDVYSVPLGTTLGAISKKILKKLSDFVVVDLKKKNYDFLDFFFV